MIAAGEFPPTIGTKCHARRQFGPRKLARAQLRQKLHGRRRSWPACRRRLPWPVAIAPGHGAHHHHSFTIPIEDDELEPRGAYSYWECREGRPLAARVHGSTGVREDKRRALPGQDYARTDERYPVVTISDAILGDSSHHNFSCKTFGVRILSPRSMLGPVSSNPASICNPTRLHSTHLRSRSVRPS
jgi:hypothetical protein